MKINNHEPITKRNDVNTDKYSTLLILKNNKYVTDIIFSRFMFHSKFKKNKY